MLKKLIWLLTATLAFTLAGAHAPATAVNIGHEGCTPGYWKNHTDNWEEYTPDTKLSSLWTFPASLSKYGDWTMLEALSARGGTGLAGATRILLRAAVAAYLNAAHEGVGYPYRRMDEPGDLQDAINAALASEKRSTILSLATKLDQANNLGCPLN